MLLIILDRYQINKYMRYFEWPLHISISQVTCRDNDFGENSHFTLRKYLLAPNIYIANFLRYTPSTDIALYIKTGIVSDYNACFNVCLQFN